MKARHKRFAIIIGALATLGAATFFVLKALDSNISLYITPTEVAQGKAPKGKSFSIGGLVKPASLDRRDITAHFVITDTVQEIPVSYTGILPDLFKEGKGVVAQGKLGADGIFIASTVLAKHDENYMPPPAKAAVDKAQSTAKTQK
ncbi:MAG: cytochrome c maturation protein CcmE [Formivibrio sp.]|nr:cytochrome c maturation protein CcmE [Formivibrio sp.]